MTSTKINKVFICATEQSGDNIGFNIIHELLKYKSNIVFDGVGGNKMNPYLNKQFYSLKDFKSIGIVEIFFSLKKYIQMINYLAKRIIINKYDLIITIDSPDFNYPLINKIRKKNFSNNIIQIVAPSVWAWRKNRAKKFSIVYNEIFVLFNFESKYFNKFNLKTTFIGHPIYYIKSINPNIYKNNIAFLPGSRQGELKKLLPYFKIAYEYLLKNHSNLIIFIPTMPHLYETLINYTKSWKMKVCVTINSDDIEGYFLKTKFALVCSGTASLEVAKRNIPQLIIYKINLLTEFFLSLFIKIKFANLINIIEDKLIIPELTNSKLNEKDFLQSFSNLITNHQENNNQIININKSLKQFETGKPPYKVAANRILKYL